MKKYLIYKLTGGLNHTLHQLNKAIHLSKATNRILIFDGYNGAYGDKSFPFFHISDFHEHFNVPSLQLYTDYSSLYNDKNIDNALFESYMNSHFKPAGKYLYESNGRLVSPTGLDIINSNDKVIFCGWIRHESNLLETIPWYIRVNSSILNDFKKKRINGQYIGVHYRNTDTMNKLSDFIPKIYEYKNTINKIYLATDDFSAYDRLYDVIGNDFDIIQYSKPIKIKTTTNENLRIYRKPKIGLHHYLKNDVIYDTLMDMYHLVNSTHFIYSDKKYSSLSDRVSKLRNHDNFFMAQ